MAPPWARRNLLITLDCFDTLFRPKLPVGLTYLKEAENYGLDLQKRGFTHKELEKAFKQGLFAHRFHKTPPMQWIDSTGTIAPRDPPAEEEPAADTGME